MKETDGVPLGASRSEESFSCPVRPFVVVGRHTVSDSVGSNRAAGAEAHLAESATDGCCPSQ